MNLSEENTWQFGIASFAQAIGASEPALRLLISILFGYPFALIYRLFVLGKSPILQHLYFISCGLFLGYFNYGTDILHSVFCIVVVYVILKTLGGTLQSVIVSFVFFMGYLIYSYFSTGTDDYDIKWSMAQCVLTLRLIGLTYDVYDGKKDQAKLPHDQKKTALTKCPSILEIAAHTYFFGGFMVGPQFPMKRYLDFVNGNILNEKIGEKTSCILASMKRLGLGVIVLSVFQVGSLFVPEKILLTDEFLYSFPLWKRLIITGLWGKFVLYKYISCWLLTEGCCILTGLTYNGRDENGEELWNGCANVAFWEFSKVTTFGQIIKSFNVNTNLWIAQYIFKRLKFLGNKLISQGASLSFLAVWHGLHSGYYMTFLNEFIVMYSESDILMVLKTRLPKLKAILDNSALEIPLFIIMKIHVDIFMGYCLIPFVLLSWDRYFKVYSSLYFLGHLIYGGWVFAAPIVRMLIPRSKERPGKEE